MKNNELLIEVEKLILQCLRTGEQVNGRIGTDVVLINKKELRLRPYATKIVNLVKSVKGKGGSNGKNN